MQHEHRVKHQIHYASLEEVSKKKFMTIYKSNYTQKCSNYYNKKSTYVIIYWNLLHALKTWNCFNFIQKRRLIFFLLNQVAIY